MSRSRLPVVAAAVLGSLVVTYAATASTLFVPDSDTATLVSILANGIKQLDAINQEIGQVTKVYSQTKQLVSYAADAGQAFSSLVHWDFARLEGIVDTALPNAAFISREAQYGYKSWGQGTGELELMIGFCLRNRESSAVAAANAQNARPAGVPQGDWAASTALAAAPPAGADPCDTLQTRLTGQEIANSLQVALGVPVTATSVQRAAETLARTDAQTTRDLARAGQSSQLAALCQGNPDKDKCNAAAMTAQVGSYGQLVELTERVGDLNRTEALRFAQDTARDQREAQERTQIVQDAVDALPTEPMTISAPGFHFTEGQ